VVVFAVACGAPPPVPALAPPRVFAQPAIPENAGSDDDVIRQELDEILEHPDFRRLRLRLEPREVDTGWVDRFFDWLREFFRPVQGADVSWVGEVFRILAYAIIAALACAIVWLVVKAINSWRARQRERLTSGLTFEEGGAALPPGDIPADEYLRRAQELSAQGQFGEAIAQLLLGAMSATERSGLIRFRHGLTYRDYVRALRPRSEPCASFRTMVAIYLPIGFGRRSAALPQFERALAAYQLAFSQVLSPVLEPATSPKEPAHPAGQVVEPGAAPTAGAASGGTPPGIESP